MPREEVHARVAGGELVGWRQGSGPRVLLLHGGPGLSCDYLEDVVGELGAGYDVAWFQQRGLPPSVAEPPFTVATAVDDVVSFLDALGWDRAFVLGHSWGGHLLWHLLVSTPERLDGGLAVDPLGGVGDGGNEVFEQAMNARIPEENRVRAEELDRRAMAGEGTEDDVLESMRLYWPAYFADPGDVPPMPPMRSSIAAYAGLWESLKEQLPALEAALPAVDVPLGVVVCERSPIPADEAGVATAAAIPGAWVERVEGAGHFPWYERPGAVRAALDRLTARG
ncbi:MAG TPA: alpha/beta hydrolase [Actinomycetes bacterium]|nr:alpha/beta hydrolase [Actinomycetes bacterium]